ncbi:hypothetical protein QL285_052758 [Trifolium repens]|nr:hypothetical protein QL285_052758 [Trifolium repens]
MIARVLSTEKTFGKRVPRRPSMMKPHCKIRDGENITAKQLWAQIEKAFDDILFSREEDDYVASVLKFRQLCYRFPRFLRYVEETILDTDRESRGDLAKGWAAINKMLILQFNEIQATFGRNMSVLEHTFKGHYLYPLLVYKISRNALNHIRGKELRDEECGMDSKKCGCLMRKIYGLPCACVIARKMKNKLPIRLDEVNAHWKRLCFLIEEGGESDDDDYSCLAEWQVIQKRLKRVDVSMKGAIRDQLREIAFPETTSLKAPKENVAPKGGKKKRVAKGTSRVTRSKNQSTSREPSGWEHVDKQYPGTQASQNKPSSSKSKAKVSEPSPTRIIPRIGEMPKFMHPYIDDIVDVVGDGFCGYRCMALDYSGNEDDFELIKFHMLKELNLHKETYMKVYSTERRFNYIRDALYPPKRKILPGHVAPMDKWLTFPDMGHILATHYNKVVVELTEPGERISETFFPLRVKLKEGCPLPPTCLEWKNHRSEEATEWEYPFMDRQSTYVDLVAQHMKGKPKKILTGVGSSKDEPYIY